MVHSGAIISLSQGVNALVGIEKEVIFASWQKRQWEVNNRDQSGSVEMIAFDPENIAAFSFAVIVSSSPLPL